MKRLSLLAAALLAAVGACASPTAPDDAAARAERADAAKQQLQAAAGKPTSPGKLAAN